MSAEPHSRSETPLVTVVVPCKAHAKELSLCLASLTRQVTSFPYDAKEAVTGTLASTDGLHLGTYRGANERYFDGALDEVAIWNRVLTAGELERLWDGGRGFPVTRGR
mgnify:CR=1 FL=1